MKVILLAVTSLDGFITRGSEKNIYSWTSPEEQKIFFEKIEKAKLIMMGGNTYRVSKHLMKHTKGKTRIIFTRTPEKYKVEEISGILEFTSDSPKSIFEGFEKLGVKEALLVGGPELNSYFLKLGLISELHLSIEPVIFGSGKRLFEKGQKISTRLISFKKLNSQGTMLLRYKIRSS